MKCSTILATFLAAMATASPTFTTTTKDSIVADTVAPMGVPICTFDPVKGVYVCPSVESANTKTNADTTSKGNNTVTAAADCNKCKRDLHECMKHWGCWFYDCLGPCKCDVGRKDPQCLDCNEGKCYT